MSLALGVDLVSVPRIQRALARFPERFLSRHFTQGERADCAGDPRRLAARWAAKEAASKALGTGIGPIGWHELEVRCDEAGAPALRLHGAAAARAEALGIEIWSVSLTHTDEHAAAVVAGIGAGVRAGDRAGSGHARH